MNIPSNCIMFILSKNDTTTLYNYITMDLIFFFYFGKASILHTVDVRIIYLLLLKDK